MMRLTTQNVSLLGEDDEEREYIQHQTPSQRIVARRGAFKWLPGSSLAITCQSLFIISSLVYCTTDVAHGSWFFILFYLYIFNFLTGGLFGALFSR
jgi:hypothetical protein